MKYILVLLLAIVGCTSGGQKEQDLEQILTILLDDADNFASSYTRYYATKKFVIGRLSKDHRDIEKILSINWESNNEVHIPAGDEWRKLANEAANVKDEEDLIFKLGRAGEFFLIPIQESDELERDEVDGVISFSDLAFSEQRNRAVIYVAFICGGECGYGALYFLSKDDQNWKVVGNRGTWIAFNPVDVFSGDIKKGNYY
ncbi:MAG: hypothetical protein ACFB15_19455 [Cyclobacteriaceae bacterium]